MTLIVAGKGTTPYRPLPSQKGQSRMKRIFAIVSLLALVFVAGAALAAPVTVDFSVLGINSIDITRSSNPNGYTLNGVNFWYDNQGSAADTASVDASGIFGTTNGLLAFDFAAPATALNFDFSLLGATGSLDDGLFIMFKNGGNDVADMLIPATFIPYDPNDLTQGGDAMGTLSYSGAAFDQAQMYLSLGAPYFSVSNLSYEPVPEPGSLMVLGSGVVGLLGLMRRRAR